MATDDPTNQPHVALRELGTADYVPLTPLLQAIAMNTLFACAVLERRAPGRVFADSPGSPAILYVVHDHGMSLLVGTEPPSDAHDAAVAQVLARHRTAPEWLQVHPEHWTARIHRMSAIDADSPVPAVERFTRVNFQFSREAFEIRRPPLADRTRHHITRLDRAAFAMPGSVVPRAFWTDVDQFLEAGAAFAVMIDGQPAALAFSACVTRSQLEIGIETLAPFRGRGLARLACVALIDHCLAVGLEPVWACRLENTASHRLAESLGFQTVRHLPYFRLPPTAPSL